LLAKLAAGRNLEGAVVTIDAIACNPQIAQSIRDAGADYLLAVRGNQPSLQADIEAAFEAAHKGQIDVDVDVDKGHGRIETRTVSVLRQVDWLDGDRRFPGEVRFDDARAIVRVEARIELKDRSRSDVRCYITSSGRSAAELAQNVRGHWAIENTLHWTLDVTFQEDLSRVRKGHGAQNMALVRKFAFNKLRAAPPFSDPSGDRLAVSVLELFWGGASDRLARATANSAHKAGADAHAATVTPAIREAQAAGAKSLRQIAAALNGRGIATARGGKLEARTVANVLRRVD
jgi:predicted transposase YbfD/YdcC